MEDLQVNDRELFNLGKSSSTPAPASGCKLCTTILNVTKLIVILDHLGRCHIACMSLMQRVDFDTFQN